LVRAVKKHCPSDLLALREDLVQTALLKLLERGVGKEAEVPRASYGRQVAFTVVIDELRRKRRQQAQRVALEAHGETQASPADVGLAIRQCLERLPEARRAAVTLYLQGSRAAETARALGWKEKRVENLLYRGLEELRQCLGTRGVE
jgi:RNA polymerase sigma-70 factor, ECF subfamily